MGAGAWRISTPAACPQTRSSPVATQARVDAERALRLAGQRGDRRGRGLVAEGAAAGHHQQAVFLVGDQAGPVLAEADAQRVAGGVRAEVVRLLGVAHVEEVHAALVGRQGEQAVAVGEILAVAGEVVVQDEGGRLAAVDAQHGEPHQTVGDEGVVAGQDDVARRAGGVGPGRDVDGRLVEHVQIHHHEAHVVVGHVTPAVADGDAVGLAEGGMVAGVGDRAGRLVRLGVGPDQAVPAVGDEERVRLLQVGGFGGEDVGGEVRLGLAAAPDRGRGVRDVDEEHALGLVGDVGDVVQFVVEERPHQLDVGRLLGGVQHAHEPGRAAVADVDGDQAGLAGREIRPVALHGDRLAGARQGEAAHDLVGRAGRIVEVLLATAGRDDESRQGEDDAHTRDRRHVRSLV